MDVTATGIRGSNSFPPTSWSVVRHAQDPRGPDYRRHLNRLIQLYWRPVFAVIRHGWQRSSEDAKDLTQEFFATVILDDELVKRYAPERGSFRSLLRAAIAHFMQNTVRAAQRVKRGGGLQPLPLNMEDADDPRAIPGIETRTPEEILELAWRQTVVNEAVRLLQEKLVAEGKASWYEAFKRYDFEGGSAELSYETLGAQLSLAGWQVKRGLIETRALFRQIVTDLVRGYVDDPPALADELRFLFEG